MDEQEKYEIKLKLRRGQLVWLPTDEDFEDLLDQYHNGEPFTFEGIKCGIVNLEYSYSDDQTRIELKKWDKYLAVNYE